VRHYFLVASVFPASVEAAGDRALLIFAGGALQILSSAILLRPYGELGEIIVAVPTASPQTCEEMRTEADDVVCAISPEPFYSVGLWYEDFRRRRTKRCVTYLRGAPRRSLPVRSNSS
jgi:predicted phosphoribosyltransferase